MYIRLNQKSEFPDSDNLASRALNSSTFIRPFNEYFACGR